MKKLYKICLLSIFALVGCGEETAQLQIYRSSFENGKNVEAIKENKDSEKDLFYTIAFAFADDEKDFTVNSNDFKANVDGKEYQCLYFIEQIGYEKIGEEEMVGYIVSTSTSSVVKHGNTASNFLCAFDVDLTETFILSYQNITLKKFGE